VADSAAEARIDQALVARALLGNEPRAFDQLVRRHQGMIRAQLRRLLHGGQSVVATADEVGYESEAAFSRTFKKLMGAPPAVWRRNARHGPESPPAGLQHQDRKPERRTL